MKRAWQYLNLLLVFEYLVVFPLPFTACHSVGHGLREWNEVGRLLHTLFTTILNCSSIRIGLFSNLVNRFSTGLRDWGRGKPRGSVGSRLLGTSGSCWWVWRCVGSPCSGEASSCASSGNQAPEPSSRFSQKFSEVIFALTSRNFYRSWWSMPWTSTSVASWSSNFRFLFLFLIFFSSSRILRK